MQMREVPSMLQKREQQIKEKNNSKTEWPGPNI
jgi:hypothetical protein